MINSEINCYLPTLDSSINDLKDEAEKLFRALDLASEKIRHLETSLINLKANFNFRIKIGEDERVAIPVSEHHRETFPLAENAATRKLYFLGWETDDASQKFRLCLISDEVELVSFNYDDNFIEMVYEIRHLSRRPLIETDLGTRLRYLEHLTPFVNAFKEHLKASRLKIEFEDL